MTRERPPFGEMTSPSHSPRRTVRSPLLKSNSTLTLLSANCRYPGLTTTLTALLSDGAFTDTDREDAFFPRKGSVPSPLGSSMPGSPCATSMPERRRRGSARGGLAAGEPTWRDGEAVRAARGRGPRGRHRSAASSDTLVCRQEARNAAPASAGDARHSHTSEPGPAGGSRADGSQHAAKIPDGTRRGTARRGEMVALEWYDVASFENSFQTKARHLHSTTVNAMSSMKHLQCAARRAKGLLVAASASDGDVPDRVRAGELTLRRGLRHVQPEGRGRLRVHGGGGRRVRGREPRSRLLLSLAQSTYIPR